MLLLRGGVPPGVPLFGYTAVHAYTRGWLPLPAVLRTTALSAVVQRRVITVCWGLTVLALVFLASDWYQQNPPEEGALGAVGLISGATVRGAVVASRFSSRMGLWLSLASAVMTVTARRGART